MKRWLESLTGTGVDNRGLGSPGSDLNAFSLSNVGGEAIILESRPWAGRLLRPKTGFEPHSWGAGFLVDGTPVEAFGIVVMPPAKPCSARVRLWHRAGADPESSGEFSAPGALAGDNFLGEAIHDLADLLAEKPSHLATMAWFPLPGGAITQPGRYIVDVGFTQDGAPFAPEVGICPISPPWRWSYGFFATLAGRARPAKFPLGLAWALRGIGRQETISAVPIVSGGATANGFDIYLDKIRLHRPSGVLKIEGESISVPPPAEMDGLFEITAGVRNLVPFRHFDAKDDDSAINFNDLRTFASSDTSRSLGYAGHYCRYDLISLDPRTGRIHLTLGQERALDPEEFPAALPAGHVPLYSLYTSRNGAEPISLIEWRDMVRIGREAEHLAWLEYCRRRLPRTMKALRTGGDFRLAGYGDSITSLGGRLPDQRFVSNGRHRDMMTYLECYGDDWKAALPLYPSTEGEDAIHHRIGWNWYLKAEIERRSDCTVTYDNWGIAGTTSGSDVRLIDGTEYPNAANPDRLSRMLATRPDLVTLCVGMNDIGDNIDTAANIVAIGRQVREAAADLIVIAPVRHNPRFNSRDESLWKLTHDTVIAAALELDCAYLSTWDIFGDGCEGATGLSRNSHCVASMGNHPGPQELAAVGRYLSKIIP